MRFLIASSFKQPGGYATLCEGFALDLVAAGHEVTVIGIGADGRENYYPFSLNPAQPEFVPQMLQKLDMQLKPDCICLLGDIPNQLAIVNNLNKHFPGWVRNRFVVSFFPVESDPFYADWVTSLRTNVKMMFTYTEFGVATAKAAGLNLHHLPFCLNDFWYETLETKDSIKLDGRYVLTVAANQHRKNIPAGMRMMKPLLEKDAELRYVLITEVDKKDGWDLAFEAKKIRMPGNKVVVLASLGITNLVLKGLYANASAFLLPSIAEGIGIPLYEAASQGCPLVATDCCAISEVLKEVEGFPIAVGHVEAYPWGNVNHYYPSIESGTEQLSKALAVTDRKKSVKRQTSTNKFLNLLVLFQEAMRVKEAPEEIEQPAIRPGEELGTHAASEILG